MENDPAPIRPAPGCTVESIAHAFAGNRAETCVRRVRDLYSLLSPAQKRHGAYQHGDGLMLPRERLEALFLLGPAASDAAVADCSRALGEPLPDDYVAFLKISNGLATPGRLVLLKAEDLAQRNFDYEVQEYLPGHVMIGDDSGSTALLLRRGDRTVYEVGMGTMDEETKQVSATSLEELLIVHEGKTLLER